ncbi:MAG TPA: TIGR03067 domain-containing protein [Pirellulales bacterium]
MLARSAIVCAVAAFATWLGGFSVVCRAEDPLTRVDRLVLQGRWEVVAVVQDGVEKSPAELRGRKMEFEIKDDVMISIVNGKTYFESKFELDVSKSPRRLTLTTGERKGAALSYKIDGAGLVFASTTVKDAEPPSEFKSEKDSGVSVVTLKRVVK